MQRHDTNSVEPVPEKLDANTVGRQFLVEYYNCLRSNFDSTLNYYSDASVVKRFGAPAVSGLANIRSELQKSKLAWDSVRIFETICIYSIDESLVIQVSGEFVSQTGPRAFLQNVVLASQGPRKYYIGSDLLEWMDDLYPLLKKPGTVNIPHPAAHINGHHLASPHAPSPPEEPIQPLIHQPAPPQVYQVQHPLDSSLSALQTHIPQPHQQTYVQQPQQHGISPTNLLTHPQQAHSMVPPQHQHPQVRPQPQQQQIPQQQQMQHQIPQQQPPQQMHERQQPPQQQQQYQPQQHAQPQSVQHTQQQRALGQTQPQQQPPQTFSQAVGARQPQQQQQHGGYQQRSSGPGGPPGLQQQQQQRQYGQYGQQQQHPNNSGPPGGFNKSRYNGPRRGGPPRFQGGPPMNNGGPK